MKFPTLADEVSRASNEWSPRPYFSPGHAVQGWVGGLYFRGLVHSSDDSYLIVRVSELALDGKVLSYAGPIPEGGTSLVPPGTHLRFMRSECDPLDDLSKMD